MPWNNEDGGNKGPWGQGPANGPKGPPRKPGSLPPEIDDILKRGADNFKGYIPGGRGTWLLPVALLAAVWAYNSFYQVQPDQRGVVLRLGKYARTADPGLHFAFWPIETMETPRVGAVQQINVGSDGRESQMLTSDKNIISVPFSVQWRIADPKAYLFNVADQQRLVSSLAQSAMREVVGQTRAQMILTTGKDAVAAQVLQITQKLIDDYQAGVVLTAINLGDVQPPQEVADAFNDVVRAGQEKIKLENEAQKIRNQKNQEAEGEVAALMENANAYKAQVVAEAQGEASRFVSVYDAYKDAKDVTRRRLFLETMERVLSNSNKVILENGQNGPGVVPYLPLPAIKGAAETAQ